MVVNGLPDGGAFAAPLRVALEVRSLDRGGLERVVAELVRGLPAYGIAPLVVCTEQGGEQADRLRSEGHRVEVLSGEHREVELGLILDRYGVQLLNPHYSSLGTPVAAERRIPVVVTLHNAYAWLGAALFDELRALDEHVAGYLAVSRSVAEFCARRFHIEPRRIAVVRNGVPAAGVVASEAERRRLRAELGLDPAAELVVQVASVNRIKCQLALVDAVAALRDARPRLVAWIAGPETEADYAATVRRRIADQGLEGRVVLLGERDDVARLLGAADVFALPSVLEGLSLSALEALHAGVPAVLTRTGDAGFLLGLETAEGAAVAPFGPLPGALIDGPTVDPWAVDWRSLREIAGAEHPPHAPALTEALAAVLDDRDACRAAARGGGAPPRRLAPAPWGRAPAWVHRRAAPHRGWAKARELADSLAEERRRAAELRADLARIAQGVPSIAAGVDEVRRVVAAELPATRRGVQQSLELQGRVLQVATRTLDKLRLKHRAGQALRAITARIAGGAGPQATPGTAAEGRARPAPASRNAAHGHVAGTYGASRPGGLAPLPRPTHWLLLAVVPFDDIGGAQRSAQLARALRARGDLVTYAARFPRAESADLGLRADLPGLEVIPWSVDDLRDWLRARDEHVRVLLEVPDAQALELVRFAREQGARVIYDKIDAWEACAWASWFDPEVERAVIAVSDDLAASARLLQRRLEELAPGRPVHLVPNAVDREVFPGPGGTEAGGGVPSDLVRGERTLVYAGSLWGDWFDWDLVAGLAQARPAWSIGLIGDPPRETPLPLPANVHLLGLKPQAELASYYAAADACLIPFAPSPVVDAVNPLKVYEYLAMHRPVVATAMPELHGLPHVFTASDAAQAVAAVERAAATPPPAAQIEAFLADATWDARAATLDALGERPTIAVIVLCYDNADVIGRCVDSLLHWRGTAGYRVVVVDNGSTDGSLELLGERERRGEIELVRNTHNGCSSGRNLGLRSTRSEIVVFLDSDQWALHEGWLDPALEILRERRDVGAVAWNAGWFDPGSGRGPIVDYLPARGMTGRYVGARYRTDVAYLATSGFVSLRAVLAKTAGFDERYDPTCFEDTDLSFQIKAAGYEIAYCPWIGLGHRPHRMTGALGGYDGYRERNERYFLEKWHDRPDLFFGVPDLG